MRLNPVEAGLLFVAVMGAIALAVYAGRKQIVVAQPLAFVWPNQAVVPGMAPGVTTATLEFPA